MSANSTLLLSEGTCYFGAGQLANPNFIPCGNANLEGPQACCQKGDYCLSSNTCWNKATVVTYIAGCTDPLFRSSECPQRNNYPDQQWVALALCENGNDDSKWSGCAHHPDLITIEKENCNCNMSNILIDNPNGKESFDEIGLLPNKTGDAIQFNPTAIPTAVPSGHSGLSTGAKAGIGVGVAIAGLLLIAAGIFLFMTVRRRRNTPPTDSEKRFDELDGSGTHINEAGGRERMELPVGTMGERQKSAELSADGPIAELENTNKSNGALASTRANGNWWTRLRGRG